MVQTGGHHAIKQDVSWRKRRSNEPRVVLLSCSWVKMRGLFCRKIVVNIDGEVDYGRVDFKGVWVIVEV